MGMHRRQFVTLCGALVVSPLLTLRSARGACPCHSPGNRIWTGKYWTPVYDTKHLRKGDLLRVGNDTPVLVTSDPAQHPELPNTWVVETEPYGSFLRELYADTVGVDVDVYVRPGSARGLFIETVLFDPEAPSKLRRGRGHQRWRRLVKLRYEHALRDPHPRTDIPYMVKVV